MTVATLLLPGGPLDRETGMGFAQPGIADHNGRGCRVDIGYRGSSPLWPKDVAGRHPDAQPSGCLAGPCDTHRFARRSSYGSSQTQLPAAEKAPMTLSQGVYVLGYPKNLRSTYDPYHPELRFHEFSSDIRHLDDDDKCRYLTRINARRRESRP
jgi:hypothetical protein